MYSHGPLGSQSHRWDDFDWSWSPMMNRPFMPMTGTRWSGPMWARRRLLRGKARVNRSWCQTSWPSNGVNCSMSMSESRVHWMTENSPHFDWTGKHASSSRQERTRMDISWEKIWWNRSTKQSTSLRQRQMDSQPASLCSTMLPAINDERRMLCQHDTCQKIQKKDGLTKMALRCIQQALDLTPHPRTFTSLMIIQRCLDDLKVWSKFSLSKAFTLSVVFWHSAKVSSATLARPAAVAINIFSISPISSTRSPTSKSSLHPMDISVTSTWNITVSLISLNSIGELPSSAIKAPWKPQTSKPWRRMWRHV